MLLRLIKTIVTWTEARRQTAIVRGSRPLSCGNLRGRCTRTLYEERGWQRRGGALRGFYRTRLGAVEGRIDRAMSSAPSFHIINPPPKLLSGPHGLCFRERGHGVFWVHFSPFPRDVNAGILRIEHCIEESLKCRS